MSVIAAENDHLSLAKELDAKVRTYLVQVPYQPCYFCAWLMLHLRQHAEGTHTRGGHSIASSMTCICGIHCWHKQYRIHEQPTLGTSLMASVSNSHHGPVCCCFCVCHLVCVASRACQRALFFRAKVRVHAKSPKKMFRLRVKRSELRVKGNRKPKRLRPKQLLEMRCLLALRAATKSSRPQK